MLADEGAEAATLGGQLLHALDLGPAGGPVVVDIDVAVPESDRDRLRFRLVGDDPRVPRMTCIAFHG